ncbi:hypothetical protein V5799_007121 [Amblyomma americanum]|uniref:Uncharacterized protein n=1 Tax=Amblyomma americanum TaxID=6943 RepID=A0AAQ4DUF8_AMBAM
MRRGFVLLVMVVILAVPFSLGTVLYRVGSLEAASLLFGISQQSQQPYAYNDRIGREVAPHALWREHGPQWQSPHPGLKVFAAHYRHDLGPEHASSSRRAQGRHRSARGPGAGCGVNSSGTKPHFHRLDRRQHGVR